MIYFLHGTDIEKARVKARELYEGLLKKKPDAELFRADSENFESLNLDEKIESQGLFENKFIIFCDRVFENKLAKEEIVSKIKAIGNSENIFIFLEQKVDKATLGKIEKVAAKVQAFDSALGKSNAKPAEFNVFSMTDALGRRDKKNLWVLFTEAKQHEIAAEQIHGVLFWKIKTMILNNSAGKFSLEELKKISAKMVKIYHEAHRGAYELDSALEQVILTL